MARSKTPVSQPRDQEAAEEIRVMNPQKGSDDEEPTLRPQHLSEYVGQKALKESLGITLAAAQKRKEALEHLLLSGPPGLGKTTLAAIIAREMEVNLKTTSGPVIERAGDLAALLTNLQPHDLLFIDEIHRLPRVVEEVLYPAMEDFQLDIMIGKGPTAKAIRLQLPPFTLVGATTRAGKVSAPLRDRFGLSFRLEFYQPEELTDILKRSSQVLKIKISDDGAAEIARRSRGTPRLANRLLKRVRDFADIKRKGAIDREVADSALKLLEVDELGLDRMDRRILSCVVEKFSGGPVGLETLAMAVGEEPDTVEDVYEPFLVQIGFLQRTSNGRKATPLAFRHLGMNPPASSQGALL
ncbi:MAG TPA: Holliday junction branch migration DNA helicase RuvB [bacterium]|nr:Holliday junction branch migration DNA helicase RuvB [bacterium]